MTQVG